jgi:hypothetical protein
MKFTYNSGQKPLEGYTLKHGVGRGGFGEVYHAVSDGGKEVALKLIQGNLDTELRGMKDCLNLKHPNLVSLFDIRTDSQGDYWVVMEYISGEPLNVILGRHPNGLPLELAQQWFLALTRAVGYLHDHGIVHRDLKPANLFVENGLVKVGDYGLCKFISGSHRSAQTQSVGTVHYMAPEISTGKYTKQIDIYAAGIILYEMLTGRVPFDGESAGEILMKHLTAPPDLTKLPADYVTIVGKALAKDPTHRYASMAEMAKAIEGIGKQAAPPAQAVEPPRVESPPPVVQRIETPSTVSRPGTALRGQVAELCGSMALAAVLSAVASILWGAMGQKQLTFAELGQVFFLSIGTSWAVLVPAKVWSNRRGDSWARRIIMMTIGLGVGTGAIWIDGWNTVLTETDSANQPVLARSVSSRAGIPVMAQYLSYFALAFFVLRWWKLAERHRSHRFSFAPILVAGIWGYILSGMLLPDPWQGTLVLTTTAAIVQLVSPWEQSPPAPGRKLRLRYA